MPMIDWQGALQQLDNIGGWLVLSELQQGIGRLPGVYSYPIDATHSPIDMASG